MGTSANHSEVVQGPYAYAASKAYALASCLRPALEKRSSEAQERLRVAGCEPYVRGVRGHVTSRCMLTITMDPGDCISVLQEGAYLNMFELQAKHEVEGSRKRRKQLTIWDRRRKYVEQVLRFGTNVHYASLSFGGIPEPRYGRGEGECCLVLDLAQWQPYATSYAGDSCRMYFERSTTRVSKDLILSNFAIADDWWELILLLHEEYFKDAHSRGPGIDPREIRQILEDPNLMIEVHLHGPVTVKAIKTVIISPAYRTRCLENLKRLHRPGAAQSDAFTDAVKWQTLMNELAHLGIEPLIGEDK